MGDTTKIAWTDHTFNPWMGCAKVSAGCANCYAETFTRNRMGKSLWGADGTRQVTSDANWRKPLRWNRDAEAEGRRHRVFCASLCDVFEDHPVAEETRPRLWRLIAATPCLDWQLLTKRPEAAAGMAGYFWDANPNVWIGTSIEGQWVAERADVLRWVPAAVRFISYEPALGPLDIDLDGIHWVICGGESGPGYRPMDLDWARAMRDRCRAADVAFFFKQQSGPRPGMGDTLDGERIQEFP